MTIILKPGSVPLETLEKIYREGLPVRIDPAFHAGIEKAAARIAEIAAGDAPVYGINTGFGKLASIRIAAGDVATLQRNLILSHCCGVGEPLSENIVRLIMALKLVSLGRGASGVRLEVITLIEAMLEKGVIPMIPEKGSVGASGDLAPLAHMTAAMIGEGEAFYRGERLSGAKALGKAGLKPVGLQPRKGWRLSTAPRPRPRLHLQVFSAPTARHEPRSSPAHYPPMPPWDRMRLSMRKFTSFAAIRDRSMQAGHCAPCLKGLLSAEATLKATSACRIPIASAASRRLTVPVSIFCARPHAHWKSKPMP